MTEERARKAMEEEKMRDPEYYARFPGEFSEPPQTRRTRETLDFNKLIATGAAVKFSNKKNDWPAFKKKFITFVHSLLIPVSEKLLSLELAIEKNDRALSMFFQTNVGSPKETYLELIVMLIEAHEAGMSQLEAGLQNLEQLPIVKRFEYESMKLYTCAIQTYILSCRAKGELIGPEILRIVFNKLTEIASNCFAFRSWNGPHKAT